MLASDHNNEVEWLQDKIVCLTAQLAEAKGLRDVAYARAHALDADLARARAVVEAVGIFLTDDSRHNWTRLHAAYDAATSE